jgi:HAMP domain-containing protein
MGKFNLKDQLAGVAALIAAIVAIGGGFVKYGEITTKLDAITAPDLTPLAQTIGNVNAGMADNQTNIAVMQKEIELLKLQLEEIKVSTSNPLSQ